MRSTTPAPAPAERTSPRPDYYPWPGLCRRKRCYTRDVCVLATCVTLLLVAAHALGYV